MASWRMIASVVGIRMEVAPVSKPFDKTEWNVRGVPADDVPSTSSSSKSAAPRGTCHDVHEEGPHMSMLAPRKGSHGIEPCKTC